MNAFERVLVLNPTQDWAGVYSIRMSGEYDTYMVFDGTEAECREWLHLVNQPRDDVAEARLIELSTASPACPLFKTTL